ncbi:AL2 [Tomato bright yellow mottle virus]|uniref:Replication enhancer protein n=1 Tax=Tomato bright yellow mottle virus TaxID=858512 RepID=R9S9X4_9GEMI|nr:AL2 [Tomato bright yellow mottle virus]AGN12891.1 AL2 [Tomato bright yellow mottle virus]
MKFVFLNSPLYQTTAQNCQEEEGNQETTNFSLVRDAQSTCTFTAEDMDSRTGERITRRQAENGVYTWEVQNPLYFKITNVEILLHANTTVYHIQIRFNHNLRRALDLHKAYLNFQVWTTSLTASGTTYFYLFLFLVNMYFLKFGVISI